jgi:hypothetical protein
MLRGNTIVIVSGGPSLIPHWQRGQAFLDELADYDSIIAVNHCAEKVEADWWVFIDTPVFISTAVKGTPVVFGHGYWPPSKMGTATDAWRFWPRVPQEGCHDEIPRVDPDGPCPIYTGPAWVNWRDHKTGKNNLPQWNRYSGLAALGLALLLKPEAVDLYGYDNAGQAGCMDAEHPDVPRNRDDFRWKTERAVFDWYMTEYEKAKIRVRRI